MRYSKGFKASVIRKVLQSPPRSINEVAKETGIYPATISDWIRQHKAGTLEMDAGDALVPTQRHPGEKMALLLESKTIATEELGEWLRRNGLHSEHLPLWEQELTSIMSNKTDDAKSEIAALRKENKELKKELARKEKALAETAVLLTLKKKFPNLFETDAES
jgi:transposase